VEQRVVVTAAEGEVRDGVGRRQLVPRFVALVNGNSDLPFGAFDVLVGDAALFGGQIIPRRFARPRVGTGLLGGGHRSS
jgi:hypothetical protein